MSPHNTLKETIQDIRISTESQTYRAAASISEASIIFTKERQVEYITTFYENGTYDAAKQLLDTLRKDPRNKDMYLSLADPVEKIYTVTSTQKIEGAWSAWS